MIKQVVNGDILIGSLRNLLNEKDVSKPTRELVEFILADSDISKSRHRLSSLMVICQRIFEDHPASLFKMVEMVARSIE